MLRLFPGLHPNPPIAVLAPPPMAAPELVDRLSRAVGRQEDAHSTWAYENVYGGICWTTKYPVRLRTLKHHFAARSEAKIYLSTYTFIYVFICASIFGIYPLACYLPAYQNLYVSSLLFFAARHTTCRLWFAVEFVSVTMDR